MLFGSFVLLSLLTLCLTNLIHQRISVPELKQQRNKNTLVLIYCLSSCALFSLITYYNKEILQMSKSYFSLVDNGLVPLFLFTTLGYVYLSYELIIKIDTGTIPLDGCNIIIKRYLLLIMFIQSISCMYLI